MNKPQSGASNTRSDDGIGMEEVQRLVKKAQHGDQEAFGMLVTTFHQRLYAVVYNFVQDTDDANELVQQTWIKVWRKLETFKGKSEFFTWVYRVASFVCLDFLRKRKRQREDPIIDDWEPVHDIGAGLAESSNPRPDEQVAHGEVRERFEEALQNLSPEHRQALMLREVEGYSYDDIARMMKCRKGTVMSRIYYARKNIQEHLKDVR